MSQPPVDRDHLHTLLHEMDLPPTRIRKPITAGNVMWLLRNIQTRNKEHPGLREAQILLVALMREL